MKYNYNIYILLLLFIVLPGSFVYSMGEPIKKSYDDTNLSYIIESLAEKSKDKNKNNLSERAKFARTALHYAKKTQNNEIIIKAYLTYADILITKGNYGKAIYLLNELDDKIFYSINDSLKVELLNEKGIAYHLAGFDNKAFECYYKALELANQKSLLENKVLVLNNLGSLYEKNNDRAKAIQYFNSAHKLAEQHGYRKLTINSLINIGRASNVEFYSDSTLIILKNTYEESKDIDYHIGLINSALALSKKLLLIKEFPEALKFINEAEENLKYVNEPILNAGVYFYKGEIMAGLDDNEKAVQYFKRSLEVAGESDKFDLIRNNYKRIADIYSKMDKDHEALFYIGLYSDYNQKIENIREEDIVGIAKRGLYLYSNESTTNIESDHKVRFNLFVLLTIFILGVFIVSIFYLFKKIKIKKKQITQLQESVTERDKNKRALKFSESKYYSLIRALNEGLVYLDSENNILFLNEKACNILGGIFDDLINRSIYEFIVEEEDIKTLRDRKELKKKGITDRHDIKIKKVQGDVIWVRISLSPLFDEKNQWIGNVGMLSDITERIKYDNSMKELTASLNQKIKQLDCLYDISDITSIPGITFEDIFVKSLSIIPYGLKYSHDACVEIVFENKKFRSDNFVETQWSYVVPIKVQKKKLGHIRVCYIEEKPFVNKDPFHFNEKILVKNIAEKLGQVIEAKNMKGELNKSKHKLELTQKTANIGNWEWDIIRNRKYFSESFFNVLEMPAENRFFFDDEMLFKIIHNDDKKYLKNVFDRVLNYDFSDLNFDLRFIKPNGNIKNIRFTGDVIKDVNDKPAIIIFAVEDITEQNKKAKIKKSITGENG